MLTLLRLYLKYVKLTKTIVKDKITTSIETNSEATKQYLILHMVLIADLL